jgi:hypothetical protein
VADEAERRRDSAGGSGGHGARSASGGGLPRHTSSLAAALWDYCGGMGVNKGRG